MTARAAERPRKPMRQARLARRTASRWGSGKRARAARRSLIKAVVLSGRCSQARGTVVVRILHLSFPLRLGQRLPSRTLPLRGLTDSTPLRG